MEAEVRAWLEGWFPDRQARIDLSDILGSLELEGDNAHEVFEDFAERFDVDMQGFDPWFHYDADEPPSGRIGVVGRDGRWIARLPINIADLTAAAAAGRWSKDYEGIRLKRRLFSSWNIMLMMMVGMALLVAAGLLHQWVSAP